MADAREQRLPETPVEGDSQSLPGDVETIAEQLRAAVARAVRRVCPRWLADEADDLTQIATTRVLARVNDTTGRVAFTSGYLYRAAYSALVDEIRARRRRREDPIEDEAVLPGRGPTAGNEAWEIRDALMACPGATRPSPAPSGDASPPGPFGG